MRDEHKGTASAIAKAEGQESFDPRLSTPAPSHQKWEMLLVSDPHPLDEPPHLQWRQQELFTSTVYGNEKEG